MKFPRNARIFRGRLDATPFALVFFLLVIFLMLSSLVYTPGVRLELPTANDLAGTDQASVAVAIDANGQFYFQNQWIDERGLAARLRQEVQKSPEPLALVVQADKKVSYDRLIQLALLARDAGITNSLLAAQPRPPAQPKSRSTP